jgi:tetratricopeptide (TPR) repeat protein
MWFLGCVHGAPARAQAFGGMVEQGPSSTTAASAGQASASSRVAGNAGKPDDTSVPDAALVRARQLLQLGKLSEAEAATRRHLQDHADSAEAHFLLGFILFREIGAKWREAGKEQGESLLYSSGDASGSLAEFRDAKAKESLAEFTAGARARRPNAFDLKIVALDYILLKDYIDADQWLTGSLQGDSRDAQAWYYLGRTKYSESQFPQSIEAFEQCLKLEPHNVQAEYNVGLSFEALGKGDQAIQAFENAIAWEAEGPVKDPEPFVELAHLYLQENQPEKAVPYLLQSIAIRPNVSKAHEELGKAYSLLDRLPEAQGELEKAVVLEPATASLRCMLGKVYRQEGMVSRAKAEFDRCVALQQSQSAKPSEAELEKEKNTGHEE